MSSSPWNRLSASAATSRSGPAARPCDDHDVVPERLVEHVGHRVRVGDDRNRLVVLLAFEKLPRIRPLLVDSVQRALEREAAGGDELAPDAKDSRLTRLIQIQTARIVSRTERGRVTMSIAIEGGQAEQCAPLGAVGVVNERQHGVDEQRVAACAGVRIESRRCCRHLRNAPTEISTNVADAMTATDEHAARRTIRGIADTQPRERPPAAAGRAWRATAVEATAVRPHRGTPRAGRRPRRRTRRFRPIHARQPQAQ